MVEQRKSHGSFLGLNFELLRRRQLILELTRRDITDQYSGQWLGVFWTYAHPLIMMAIYVFVFTFIFRLRIGDSSTGGALTFTTYLLAGLIPWLTTQTVMNKATTVITQNANLVKQVIFPVEVLPIKIVLSAMVTQLIFLAALLLYNILVQQVFLWSYLLLVPLLIAQIFFLIGLSYLLACIAPFFRDIKDIVLVVSNVGFYAAPILYTPGMLPEQVEFIFYFNPFTYMILTFRDALFYGSFTEPLAWGGMLILTAIVSFVGYELFERIKPLFGNVL